MRVTCRLLAGCYSSLSSGKPPRKHTPQQMNGVVMTDHATNLYGEEPPKPAPASTTNDNTPNDLASRMYGEAQTQPQKDSKPPTKTDDEARAERLYQEKEEPRGNPYALDQEDRTNDLYGGTRATPSETPSSARRYGSTEENPRATHPTH